MRKNVGLLLLLLPAALAFGAAACDGDENTVAAPVTSEGGTNDAPVTPGTDGGPTNDAATDASLGEPLFTDYVKSLIDTQTMETNRPDDWTTKSFAPDPEDPNAFAGYFP